MLETPEATEVTAVTPSDPHKPGSQTTEWRATLMSIAIGTLIVLGSGVEMFTQLHAALPDNRWVGGALGVLAGAAAVILPVLRFITGRSNVKGAQLQLEAAQAYAEASKVAPNPPAAPSR